MEEGAWIPVTGGKAEVKLDATSYTSVRSAGTPAGVLGF
jgi:hypothetical protein